MRPSGHRCGSQFRRKRQPIDSLRLLTGQQCSAIMAPIYFIQNIFSYVVALYQFERAGTVGEFPQASRFPLLKVLAVVVAAAVVLLAVRTITKRQRAAAIFADASAH